MTVHHLDPWLSKVELGQHFGKGKRWVDYRLAEGMPSAKIGGARRFQVRTVEPWLERHGHLTREGRG